jgi:hypothetical protein
VTRLFPNESNSIGSCSCVGIYLCVGDGGDCVRMSGINVGRCGGSGFI